MIKPLNIAQKVKEWITGLPDTSMEDLIRMGFIFMILIGLAIFGSTETAWYTLLMLLVMAACIRNGSGLVVVLISMAKGRGGRRSLASGFKVVRSVLWLIVGMIFVVVVCWVYWPAMAVIPFIITPIVLVVIGLCVWQYI